MTVAQLLASMDSAELSEWIAFYQLKAEEQRESEMAARAESGLQQAHGMVRSGNYRSNPR